MKWSPKLDRADPQWFVYETAIENDSGVALEGIRIIAQWSRSTSPERPETYSIGLLLGGERVYAIDAAPLGRHKNNKAGRGRPKHGQFVSGIHEHTWSEDGKGYAEDIEVEGITDVAKGWAEFLRRANVESPFQFVHPDPARNAGQADLPI